MWRGRFAGPGSGPRGRGACGSRPSGETDEWHRRAPGSPEPSAEGDRPGSGSV
jgi:hypothetical protein